MMEGGSSLVCFMSEIFCRFCSFSGIRVNSLVELVPGLWFPGLWVRLVPMKRAVIVGTSIQRCLLPARLTRAEREEWLGFESAVTPGYMATSGFLHLSLGKKTEFEETGHPKMSPLSKETLTAKSLQSVFVQLKQRWMTCAPEGEAKRSLAPPAG